MRQIFVYTILVLSLVMSSVAAAPKEQILENLPVDEQIKLVEDSAPAVVLGDMNALIQRMDTHGQGVPVVVYNSLSWSRTDGVQIDSPYPGQGGYVAVKDSSGKAYPARNIGDRLCFTAHGVPALGYKVFWIIRTTAPVSTGIHCKGTTLENQYYKVVLDSDGGFISQIYDKIRARNVLGRNDRGGVLQMLTQKSAGGGEVTLGAPGEKLEVKDLKGYGEVVIMDSGPARATISFDKKYGTSYFVQDLTLYDSVDRIDVHLTTDWQGAGAKNASTLAVSLPTAFTTGSNSFAVPCNGIANTTDNYGNPSVRWVDISDGSYGVSLLAQNTSSYEALRGVLRASLLESSDAAASSKGGTREMTYSIYPHKGDWRCGTVRRAFDLSEPLSAYIVKAHSGDLPSTSELFSISAPKGIVARVKGLDNGNGLAVSLYEATGNVGGDVLVRANIPVKYLVETDARGNVIGKMIEVHNNSFSVNLKKYQMRFFTIFNSANSSSDGHR